MAIVMEALPTEVLLQLLAFMPPRELRLLAVVSRTFHSLLKKHDEVWKRVFVAKWRRANFEIAPTDVLELSPHLERQYPCASDAYRFLCHALRPVPTHMNMDYHKAYQHDDPMHYMLQPLPHPSSFLLSHFQLAPCDERFDVSYGRSVRANAPYHLEPVVTVHKHNEMTWRVDVSSTVYFEMTISSTPPAPPAQPRHEDSWDIISIGLAPPRSVVLENHAGWESFSYGYHGEEGVYMNEPDVVDLETFGYGDTVGCGLQYADNNQAWIFFTKNGRRVGDFGCCRAVPLFPTVGMNVTVPLQVNFGHERFQYNVYGIFQLSNPVHAGENEYFYY
ncbi:hypothetical protein, variant [Aphanomyces astaci]|uniref:F-box domain-containing protein n=1 Tax=Aphanomyces astaci TaxID=112090 RepID=W4FK97_APHAT|nr:hypothetical protein, variant [Aphanomyces astaci]ETV67259.1 hypothetical protein, variant [Aphanomyces astaci]|eukprot:XP_009843246.1 hypothetical protein, variant [Aphanomyces astaci]